MHIISISMMILSIWDFLLIPMIYLILVAIAILLGMALKSWGRILIAIGVGVWVWVCHGLGWGILAGLLSFGAAAAIANGRIGF
ncbi:MAG: hypothetical protein IJ760_05660 [Bacteroidales bacterium]|nr:hypothetical protein [Bacteroidales bacterium]